MPNKHTGSGVAESPDQRSPAQRMVEDQLLRRDIQDERVLAAMLEVPRDAFVPEKERDKAWDDCALPLSHGQTISQPYMVARSLEVANLQPTDCVLEVGLGSGYQAAVMSRLCKQVVSVDIIGALVEVAEHTLKSLGYDNVLARTADGSVGYPAYAPYDAIVVAAGAQSIPAQLIEQLKPGGRLIIPVGQSVQTLTVITREESGTTKREYDHCMYVPLRGAAGQT